MRDTERHAEARWNEATFRALTDSCGDIVSLLDDQGRLIFNSSAAERISGFSREELADVDTFSFIHPDDREATRRAFADVMAAPGDMVTVQYRYRHKSGAWTWMEAVATNHLHDPAVRGVVAVSRDITQRKAAEEELRRLVAENQQLVVELRREAERKSTFLAELSHELRNPLAAVRNGVQILERAAELHGDAQRALATIDRQSSHLARLLDDLLDVARMERGEIRFEPAVVDLAEILRETVDDLRRSLTAHRVLVDLPAEPVLVRGDRVRLGQVVSNLVDNARKFTPEHGTVAVALKTTGAPGEAMLEISDDGAGIDEGDLATVFMPFARAPRTRRQSGAGLGLGLSLVKGVVELHGGTVEVESAGRDRGTRFVIRMPVVPRAPSPAAAEERRPIGVTPRTVLVIDDHLDTAEGMRVLLRLAGHRVEAAFSGADGVSRARALAPDVVVCDIGLPDMNGYEVARALRSDPATATVRLIALSGYARLEDRRQAERAGFDAHVAKPVDLRTLQELIGASGATRR